MSMPLMLRLLMVLALSVGWQVQAQSKFTINGRLKIEGGDIQGARVVVYKNGVKERVISDGLNKLSMDLEMNANYILSFEKDGYVSKKLSFNTNVPPEMALMSFTPFDYAVSIFKQYDDLNMVVFNQPVGIIRYEPTVGDFDYDTDYTKSIHAQLQQAIADVERKQKEEAQNAKRAAAEEKARAKAEAEAEKQALAEAKAKAEAEKQAAAEAKARAEAEARAQAEADKQAALAKAEADRKAAEQAKALEKAQAEAAAEEARRMQEDARIAEAKKKKEEEQKAAGPVAQAAPAPVEKKPAPAPAKEPVATPAAPSAPARSAPRSVVAQREPLRTMAAQAVRGAEQRRSTTPVIEKEERLRVDEEEVWSDRNEELIVEPNKVMTVVRLTTGDVITEYRKVTHKWGSTFYFKDGEACSQLIYEQEALSGREQLAGATPRGKY